MKLQGKRCQCPSCGEYFSTASNFDRHRVMNQGVPIVDTSVGHERWCLSEFGMEAVGLVQRQMGEDRLWSAPPRPVEMRT